MTRRYSPNKLERLFQILKCLMESTRRARRSSVRTKMMNTQRERMERLKRVRPKIVQTRAKVLTMKRKNTATKPTRSSQE